MSSTLVLGIGNRFRSDDAVGLLVAQKLQSLNLTEVEAHELDQCCGLNLIDLWKDAQSVVLVDAMCAGLPAGSVRRWEHSLSSSVPLLPLRSSHTLSIAYAITLAQVLDQLPEHLVVYGIEGSSFLHGTELSPGVSNQVRSVVRRISDECTALREPTKSN